MSNVNRRGFVYLAALIVLIVFAGCSSIQSAYHERYMRGSILKQSGDQYYLCIGKKEGAHVGQVLDVYRFTEISPAVTAIDAPVWSKDLTGKISITEVVQEHYAKAKRIQGDVRKGDIAEIKLQ